MTTETIESDVVEWEDALAMMRDEWQQVLRDVRRKRSEKRQRIVSSWETQFEEISSEYANLVNQGLWNTGPADMLSILGRGRREIFHSSILGWLFDPLAPHGIGTSFLAAFLESCEPDWKLSVDDLTIVDVRCEEARGDCRADIVVRVDSLMVVIENKVDAVEGAHQCDRLYEAFAEDGEVRFVLLSPSGRKPRTATGDARSSFRTASYRDIRQCLEAALQDTVGRGQEIARESARNYLKTLITEFP